MCCMLLTLVFGLLSIKAHSDQTLLRNGEMYASNVEPVHTFVLNISRKLHKSNEWFLSFSIDSSEIRKEIRKPSLRNSTLIRLVLYLSPGYLRIGGTEADCLIFKLENAIPGSTSLLNPNATFFMSDRQWMEICTFAKLTGFRVLFDLNVLLRKGSDWDFSNAKDLLDFSASESLDVDWQLGNEPNSFLHNFNTTVSPSQLARDFTTLRELLNTSSARLVGPDVTCPHHRSGHLYMPAEKFLHKFTVAEGSEAVDALTWHHYYLHSNASVADFLSPAVFDSLQTSINAVKKAVHGTSKPIWITESGSASGGGVAGVSDRFVSSFLFLDRLGLAAREGVGLVVRQSLYSSHYALIDRLTLSPSPEWWISYTYKRLVSATVLSIKPSDKPSDKLRLYAQCSNNGTVVVFGLNLSNVSEQLRINVGHRTSNAQLYQLTAPLLSREVLLNGEPLRLPSDSPPLLLPVTVHVQTPLRLPAYSMFFLHYDSLHSDQCQL